MEKKTKSPQKKGKTKRLYKKFEPDSPPNELSVNEKNTLEKIKKDKRAIRNVLGLNPNFKKRELFLSLHKSDVKAVWPSGYGVRLRI